MQQFDRTLVIRQAVNGSLQGLKGKFRRRFPEQGMEYGLDFCMYVDGLGQGKKAGGIAYVSKC